MVARLRRSHFLAGLAAVAGTAPLRALAGTVTTQRALFAALPPPQPGDWTRIVLGLGAKYQKQIGVGLERGGAGTLLFFETQTGMPGGSCNPSSMRKSYVRTPHAGSLLDTYPVVANVGRTENLIYRFGDAADPGPRHPQDARLRLLDEAFLYDDRPLRIMSVTPERVHVASAEHDAVRVAATFGPPRTSRDLLEHVELWHTPDVPFGVARYRATVRGFEPFEMHVYSHGRGFASMLALSLDRVRAITRDGQYGQVPS